MERLAAARGDAVIALRFQCDVELLISVMLSAQTTDVTVNRVTETLFRESHTSQEDYLAVSLDELERDIRPTGTFRQKAKNIRGAMRMLIEEYDGDVPRRSRRALGASRRRAQDGQRRASDAATEGHRRRHAREAAAMRLGLTRHRTR